MDFHSARTTEGITKRFEMWIIYCKETEQSLSLDEGGDSEKFMELISK
jgi:hypothetical protein